MSLVSLRKCPIEGCHYNKHPVYANSKSTKNHINQHDYQEKLEASYKLGIISNITERRAPQWLDEKLTEFSRNLMSGISGRD